MIPTESSWLWPALAGAGLLLALWAVEALSLRACRRSGALAHGWVYLAALLELLAAVAVLCGGLAVGLWRPEDAGLLPVDWGAAAEWLPGYVAGMALWVIPTLAVAWRCEATRATATRSGAIVRLARLLRDETLLAGWRAALAPALSLYWGAWAALAVRLAARWWLPAGAQARRRGERADLVLAGALDVAATVTLLMAGSVWLALLVRALLGALCALTRQLARRMASHSSAIGPET